MMIWVVRVRACAANGRTPKAMAMEAVITRITKAEGKAGARVEKIMAIEVKVELHSSSSSGGGRFSGSSTDSSSSSSSNNSSRKRSTARTRTRRRMGTMTMVSNRTAACHGKQHGEPSLTS